MIHFDPNSIKIAVEKIRSEYSHYQGDIVNQAISRALNRAASTGRTFVNAQIRKEYNISASRINNEIRTRSATARNLNAAIIARGMPLSLNNFQARQQGRRSDTFFTRKGVAQSRLNRRTRTTGVKGVTVTIKKGQTVNIPTAFIQTANGGITVFARGKYKSTGEGFDFMKERLPIAKLTTTSIPLMFANKDVIIPAEKKAISVLEERITHEMNWLMRR